MECPFCSELIYEEDMLQAHVNSHMDQEASAGPEARAIARKRSDERRAATRSPPTQDAFSTMMSAAAQPSPSSSISSISEIAESASGINSGALVERVGRFLALHGPSDMTVRLCHPSFRYASPDFDRRWGCGYRNLQMFVSSMHGVGAPYDSLFNGQVPGVPELQRAIEGAWRDGYDRVGGAQLEYNLSGTRKWIGATEVCAVLRAQGIRTQLLDFATRSADPLMPHPDVFVQLSSYFLGDGLAKKAHGDPLVWESQAQVTWTTLPSVYLQYQGHSRTVIGYCERPGKPPALVYVDPGTQPNFSSGPGKKPFERFLWPANMLKHAQYQLVMADGVFKSKDEQELSKQLTSVRVG